MMKYALVISALLLLVGPAAAQETPEQEAAPPTIDVPVPGTDVRGFIWGVPPADVIKYEKVVLYEKVGDTLFFIDNVNGLKTLISYEFYNNRLWRVIFDVLKDEYPQPQRIIDDYVSMEILLNRQYGDFKSRDEKWRDNYYKEKYNHWGLAVYNGHLELRTHWQTPRTDALLSLRAEKYDYKFRVIHFSPAIAAQIEQDKVKQTLGNGDALVGQ